MLSDWLVAMEDLIKTKSGNSGFGHESQPYKIILRHARMSGVRKGGMVRSAQRRHNVGRLCKDVLIGEMAAENSIWGEEPSQTS
jgi:hypothetical protein